MEADLSAHGLFPRSASWLRRGRDVHSQWASPWKHPATSVLQLVLCVEAKEIGRALCTIGACHFLGRIDHVWKGEVVTLCECLHVVEGGCRLAWWRSSRYRFRVAHWPRRSHPTSKVALNNKFSVARVLWRLWVIGGIGVVL